MEKSLDSYKFNLLHCKATFIAQLKSDLAALDRKITAELAPKQEEKQPDEQQQTPKAEIADNPAQTDTSQKSMVAEPENQYKAVKIRI